MVSVFQHQLWQLQRRTRARRESDLEFELEGLRNCVGFASGEREIIRSLRSIFDNLLSEIHIQKKFPGQGEPVDITPYVLLNKVVKKISYNLNAIPTVTRIECDDGSVYNVDHLICTVSLGVLKERHLSLFDPILPPKKIDAIESLSFGVIDKVILEFERQFWPDDWTGCVIVWNPEQLKLIREKDEARWLEGLIGFHRLAYQPNVLLGWVQGASARKMERLPAELVLEHSMMLLKMCLKDFDIPNAPTDFLRW